MNRLYKAMHGGGSVIGCYATRLWMAAVCAFFHVWFNWWFGQ